MYIRYYILYIIYCFILYYIILYYTTCIILYIINYKYIIYIYHRYIILYCIHIRYLYIYIYHIDIYRIIIPAKTSTHSRTVINPHIQKEITALGGAPCLQHSLPTKGASDNVGDFMIFLYHRIFVARPFTESLKLTMFSIWLGIWIASIMGIHGNSTTPPKVNLN